MSTRIPPVVASAGRPRHGFTLVELLVVMTIIAILSAAGFAGMAVAKRHSTSVTSAQNLRQCAAAIQEYALENKHYPEGEDEDGSSGGGSWAWQIREYLGGDSGIEAWPNPLVLNPRHGNVGIYERPEAERRKLVHYAASLVVCPQISATEVERGSGTQESRIVRPSDVVNPATTFLLGDAPLLTSEDPASGCSPYWPDLRAETLTGSPDQVVDENVLKKNVDFWLGKKAQFLCVDGSVHNLRPEEVTRRFFQLDPDNLGSPSP